MICRRCNGPAQVDKTYKTKAGTTRRGWCPACEVTLTEVSLVVYVEPKRGEGAVAVARKLEQGHLKVELKEATPEEAAPVTNTGQHNQ